MAMAQAALNATSTSNIKVIPTGTELPGVSTTASLMLSSVALSQTALPVPTSATVIESVTALPSPTFALGSATMVTPNPSATSGGPTSAASTGSGSGSPTPTSAAVHTAVAGSSGTWVFGLTLATALLFGALLL